MKWIGMPMMLCLLLLCGGCDPSEESSTGPSTVSAEAVDETETENGVEAGIEVEAEDLPSTDEPTETPAPVERDTVVAASDPETSDQIGQRPDLGPAVTGADAAHPIAGRSAFPKVGEAITQPIPAKRLSDEDQFAEPVEPTDIPDIVPWTEAKKYVGYEITVQGTIVDVGQSRTGGVNFLNFHRDWRDKFYMVIFDDLAKTLPKSVDATFRGKTLRVTGLVEEHRGRPQLKIESMDQVEFVE